MEFKIIILIILVIILLLFTIGNSFFRRKFLRTYNLLSVDEKYNFLINLSDTWRFDLLKNLRKNTWDDSSFENFRYKFDKNINEQIIIEIHWFLKKITKDKKFPILIEDKLQLYFGNFEQNELIELLNFGLSKITRISFINNHNEEIITKFSNTRTITELIILLNELYNFGYIEFVNKRNLEFYVFQLRGFK